MINQTASQMKSLERDAFVSATDTGLWDLLLASVALQFAFAPLLSVSLGDFWSSAVFVPFWIAVYFVAQWIKQKLVAPRVGNVRWGASRMTRLKKQLSVLLAINILVLIIGCLTYLNTEEVNQETWQVPIVFSLSVLVMLSILAYAISNPRFFFYGLLLAICPLIGEVLFNQGIASHHGFPMTFGFASAVIASIGLFKLFRILNDGRPDRPVT